MTDPIREIGELLGESHSAMAEAGQICQAIANVYATDRDRKDDAIYFVERAERFRSLHERIDGFLHPFDNETT